MVSHFHWTLLKLGSTFNLLKVRSNLIQTRASHDRLSTCHSALFTHTRIQVVCAYTNLTVSRVSAFGQYICISMDHGETRSLHGTSLPSKRLLASTKDKYS